MVSRVPSVSALYWLTDSWRHEHLYEKIEPNVIRSDEFADNGVGTARLLLGSQVILCTLSMLSNQRLVTAGFTRLVPLDTVIVDEASQIGLGDYIPLLGRFGNKLNKLVFIGDDKQRKLLRLVASGDLLNETRSRTVWTGRSW